MASARKLFIHVGPAKTGTSAVFEAATRDLGPAGEAIVTVARRYLRSEA